MNIILWIISGGAAGWIASLLVGADAGLGIIGNIIVGIVGAFLGGFIMDKLGHGGAPGAERPTSLVPFLTAIGGSVLLLFIINLLF
jgi:uncharacterized membrane protein YeaQ/YmgE (transglycosylase-associated protein family)